MPNKNSEDIAQLAVVNYLRLKYPKVRFLANYLSGARLPIYLAKKAKMLGQAGQGTPDLFIFFNNGKYSLLAIELKSKDKNPFKKDGMLKSDEHLKKQYDYLNYLNSIGYYAAFACGAEEAISIIDKYIANEI
jgi:hypothetical protein